MSGLKPIGVLALLALTSVTALSQFQPKNLIKHYSIREGLSQGVVNSVVEDKDHILWFAALLLILARGPGAISLDHVIWSRAQSAAPAHAR